MQYDYIKSAATIQITAAAKKQISNIPDMELEKVCKDRRKAEEKALLFCSSLITNVYSKLKGEEIEFKDLDSKLLLKQIGNKYRILLDILLDYDVIESDNHYIVEKKCKGYRLTDHVAGSRIIEYKLKDDFLLQGRASYAKGILMDIMRDPIARILYYHTYPSLSLPTNDDIKNHLMKLSKAGYRNKNGKRLIRKPKRSKQELDAMVDVVFIEDLIKLFNILTRDGLRIFTTGNDRCKRTVDSLSLMPKNIRQLIQMDGESIEEADYKCLHPNLANRLFGINEAHISHEMMSEYLGIPLTKAKKNNLSFFNYKESIFKNCEASNFYRDKHTLLYNNLLDIKKTGSMMVTYKMFELEHELMNRVFLQLEKIKIYPIHVYDAALVKQSRIDEVIEVMDRTAKEMGINTWVN